MFNYCVMGYNGKAYLAHEERRLEPNSVLITGNRRRHSTSMADKNRLLNGLSAEQREELKREAEQEFDKLKYK